MYEVVFHEIKGTIQHSHMHCNPKSQEKCAHKGAWDFDFVIGHSWMDFFFNTMEVFFK